MWATSTSNGPESRFAEKLWALMYIHECRVAQRACFPHLPTVPSFVPTPELT